MPVLHGEEHVFLPSQQLYTINKNMLHELYIKPLKTTTAFTLLPNKFVPIP